MKTLFSVFSILFLVSSPSNFAVPKPSEEKVNQKLMAAQSKYTPQLMKLGERVHAVFGYAYSNYSYVEGDDGIIVIDSGWDTGQAKRSIADYRKITNKPVVAIIYTHLHIDHFSGMASIMEGQSSDVPTYGPEGWSRWYNESQSGAGAKMMQRAMTQMGAALPKGPDGDIGNAIGAPMMATGGAFTHRPNISVREPMDVTISGVRFKLIPADGDIPENLVIWMPDDEVVFAGDIPIHSTFPALETVRFEAERDPRALITTLEMILDLSPKYAVPGHGRVLVGKEDVLEVFSSGRDLVAFMVDQLDRLYVKGLSSDEIIDTLKIPAKLKNHPEFQPHYHRIEWMIKTMYFKRAGFVGETVDYLTLTNSEEAKRLVPLLGGPEQVKAHAKAAMQKGESRWAARLATYVMNVAPSDAEAIKIRQKAFLQIARTTESANERNYLLTAIREENGELDWKKMMAPSRFIAAGNQEAQDIHLVMKSRFRAEAADGFATTISVRIDGSKANTAYTVRNNVLFVEEGDGGNVDATVSLSRNTLNKIAANLTTWGEAYKSEDIKIVGGDKDKAEFLFTLIE